LIIGSGKSMASACSNLNTGLGLSASNSGALDRRKQLAVVRQLTDIIVAAVGDPTLADRTWVLLTEAPEGGWGLSGRAYTNAELGSAARAQIADWRRTRRGNSADELRPGRVALPRSRVR